MYGILKYVFKISTGLSSFAVSFFVVSV